MCKISKKDIDLFYNMLDQDKHSLHFLWDCTAGTVTTAGSALFENVTGDPLDFLRESGLIDEQSMPQFNVFTARLEEGVISGIDRSSLSVDIRMKFTPDADYELCGFYAHLLRDESGKVLAVHGTIRPYSQKEVANKKIITTFSSDRAPQIYGQEVAEMMARHPDEEIAFIQFDVERFKLINENYGVETGDELLAFLTQTLGIICNEEQPYCRLTADVFMIVTTFDSDQHLLDFIHRLESLLSGFKGMEYRLIFGVAIAEDRTLHTRRHGDNATIARQSVKGSALNNIGFFNGRMRSELQKKQLIEENMQAALLDNQFVMFLQPKYSISTNRIIGAEALVRWIHPERGMISPAEFIPVFEENGFILKLDQIIWESACRKLRDWRDRGIQPVPVSVNISREYIHSFDVVSYLLELVKKYDVPIKLLELEITETTDAQGVSDVVQKMKDAGFTMLMDDFGSGYSSLNMLKTTQFDVLKIDRGFLSKFMESGRGRKIISHTISMSRDIGLDIIAEGVETKEQAQFLSDCGCDSAQGFYYSKPVSQEEFDRLLLSANN
ncbi:MAG: GGDEF domain-containing phosphodiesterase [Oscillospiraceae bacterium]|nr:GGDEF domain-containing phosphodiesterase [Oscillospiraceae bacterium]